MIKNIKVTTIHEQESAYKDWLEKISKPDDAASFFDRVVRKESWYDEMKECMIVLILDTKHKLLAWNLVSLGQVDMSIASPREVFRPALAFAAEEKAPEDGKMTDHATRETYRLAVMGAATTILLMHNHPAGGTTPSKQDIDLTKKMVKAGEILGIHLLDHVVMGRDDNFYSMRSGGEVNFSYNK